MALTPVVYPRRVARGKCNVFWAQGVGRRASGMPYPASSGGNIFAAKNGAIRTFYPDATPDSQKTSECQA